MVNHNKNLISGKKRKKGIFRILNTDNPIVNWTLKGTLTLAAILGATYYCQNPPQDIKEKFSKNSKSQVISNLSLPYQKSIYPSFQLDVDDKKGLENLICIIGGENLGELYIMDKDNKQIYFKNLKEFTDDLISSNKKYGPSSNIKQFIDYVLKNGYQLENPCPKEGLNLDTTQCFIQANYDYR